MLNTAAKMMALTDSEFHETILWAYDMIESWDRQIAHMEAKLPDLKRYDLWNMGKSYSRKLEIKKAARQRVKAWARRMVTLRYCTK
jgi:hypothetical protein